jgi:hypothetical protein
MNFTVKIPSQRIEPNEPKFPVGVLIRIASPINIAPALSPSSHPARYPLIEPVQHPTGLCPFEVLAPAMQVLIEPVYHHRKATPAVHRVSLRTSSRKRFASGLRVGYGPEIQRMPFRFHLAMDTVTFITGPPVCARLLVYASPLRGGGGTFTRKRSALLGAQLALTPMTPSGLIRPVLYLSPRSGATPAIIP